MPMEIIETTAAQKSIFASIYQFYMYDFSEMAGFSVEDTGRYEESDLDGCWADAAHHALLLRIDGELAGLAIVREVDPLHRKADETVEMDEFFVMRKFRSRGIGTQFAVTLFDRFPGKWRVAQIAENIGALVFWRKVIGEYTGDQFVDTTWQHRHYRGTVQYFDNSKRADPDNA